MGRLIDVDNITDEQIVDYLGIRYASCACDVRDMLNEQPTVYDPDKVVEQLEDYGNEETRYYKNTPYEKCIEECIGKAIEIMKGGGVDA